MRTCNSSRARCARIARANTPALAHLTDVWSALDRTGSPRVLRMAGDASHNLRTGREDDALLPHARAALRSGQARRKDVRTHRSLPDALSVPHAVAVHGCATQSLWADARRSKRCALHAPSSRSTAPALTRTSAVASPTTSSRTPSSRTSANRTRAEPRVQTEYALTD